MQHILNHTIRYILFTSFAFCVTIVFYACSTKKSSFTNRLYHNTTAKYNGYFNGNENLKQGVSELEKLHVDKYTEVLPVYKLGTADNATSLTSYFDKAYTKPSAVIQRHSIFLKKKEHIKWIPESYLLIGKSHFYKHDFKLASETFEYIIKQYPDFNTKYSAMIWLARAYNEQKKYSKAESMLDMTQNKIEKKEVPKKIIREFPLVYADYYIKQGKYEQAVDYLLKGIDVVKKKSIKYRLSFILAQIYQKNGNLSEASDLYSKVIKMNPPYEMAFNAKLNKAICFDPKTGNFAEIRKYLEKMAKETKNKDYLDQIYFVMAELYLKEPDTTTAIKYYKLSAEKSVSNNLQKALSFLKIANIYYNRPDYETASVYFDSTMTVLPTDYADYEKVQELQKTLSKLAENIKIVNREDSLQKISKLTKKEIYAIIDGIITEVIKEEQKTQQELINQQQNMYNTAINSTQTTTSASWYFYNTTALNFGKTEFIKKWGTRKLEDLWRLSNKQTITDFGDETDLNNTDSADSTQTASTSMLKDRNYYYKNIPFAATEVKASDDKIIEALYNIGLIYQTDLHEDKHAAETFEKLISRFPDNKYTPETYYQLYLIFTNLKNSSKKDYYKGLLCNKDPNGDLCKLLTNPANSNLTNSVKNILESLYIETYNAYNLSNWEFVVANADKAIKINNTDTSLIPKFQYLKVVAYYAKTKDNETFINALKSILDTYPTNSITPMAQVLYDIYSGDKPQKEITSSEDSLPINQTTKYTKNESALHFYVIIVNIKKIKVNELKYAISDFNTQNFSTSEITINNVFLDNERQIITLSHFENKTKALLYYNSLINNSKILSKYSKEDYTHFVISSDNYPIMYKSKDVENYFDFFSKEYLK